MMTDSDVKRRGLWQTVTDCSGTEIDRANGNRFTAWCLAWAVCYVGASMILKGDHDLSAPLTWFVVAVPNILSVVAVFSYLRLLRMSDELLRKILLEGLAMGFAAGVVLITGYQLFEAAGASELQTDHIIIVMVFGWIGGQLYGRWRYR